MNMSQHERQYHIDMIQLELAPLLARIEALEAGLQHRGRAFTQIAHDEGKPDLAALWQAVIDNTKGSGFWLGEMLLTTIEKETGFNGSARK